MKTKIYKFLIPAILGLITVACTSIEPFDYSKMSVSRMDLSGAVSLALIKDNSTRAIEGTYLRSGLYKVDANGNITAVAVFFSVDEDGKNYTEHEHSLNVRPRELYDITENFCIASDCHYYDDENDEVYVPYSFLLIRKSDGRIWSIDKQIYYTNNPNGIIDFPTRLSFTQSKSGKLYYANKDVYKFNLDSNTPSIEQITKNGSIFSDFHITEQEIIWTRNYDDITIYWPYSGFKTVDKKEFYEMEFGELSYNALDYGFEESMNIEINYIRGFAIAIDIKGNPLIIFFPKISYDKYPVEEKYDKFLKEYIKPVRADFLKIGNTTGDVKMEGNPIILQDFPEEFISIGSQNNMYFSPLAEDKILIADDSDKTWLTLMDLNKREWKLLRQLDYGIKYFYSMEYNNKIWMLDKHVDHFGCYYIDLETFEDGFVPFDFSLPDFLIGENKYSNKFTYDGKGHFTGQWIDSNDGNNYYLTIDVLSGHGEITMEEPDMYFDTLIPLN